jgi:uncharacterized protein (UPF0335 family)
MTEVQIGHNQLRSLTERINNLEDQRKEIGDDIREVYQEAKSAGYDVKALRAVIKRQRADAEKQAEHDALVETYLAALGIA